MRLAHWVTDSERLWRTAMVSQEHIPNSSCSGLEGSWQWRERFASFEEGKRGRCC